MAQRLDVQYIRFYTDGSAARQVQPVAPLKTMKLPKVKKTRRIVIPVDPIAIAGIVMAAVMMVLMVVGVVRLHDQQQQLQQMQSYVADLQVQNALLEDEFHNGYNIDEVEKTALALGLVPQEEVTCVTIKAPVTAEEEEPGSWERFYIFLTGLFA